MKNPPKEVYFIASGWKNRLYTSRGYAQLGYNSVRGYWGTDAQVYRICTGPGSRGEWANVTEEFSK